VPEERRSVDSNNVIIGPWTSDEKSKALFHHLEHLREELKPEQQGRTLMLNYLQKLQQDTTAE
jgi:hypothetical protein